MNTTAVPGDEEDRGEVDGYMYHEQSGFQPA
jgi:hypothetical protein